MNNHNTEDPDRWDRYSQKRQGLKGKKRKFRIFI